MPDHSSDEQFLNSALELARQGVGLASPNPCVGAVIVDANGSIVGTGAYTYDGMKHAEVRALEHAGDRARGATLYINLEPHSHHGRTPPCNEAFARYIRHGVPLVTLKTAMTLDGKIAPPPVSSPKHTPGIPAGGWLTGVEARAHVHEQRHQSDAILVGVGTILADDPLLTDRSGR